jgi:hypothetical protein
MRIAEEFAHGRVVEGGYHLDALNRCVLARHGSRHRGAGDCLSTLTSPSHYSVSTHARSYIYRPRG